MSRIANKLSTNAEICLVYPVSLVLRTCVNLIACFTPFLVMIVLVLFGVFTAYAYRSIAPIDELSGIASERTIELVEMIAALGSFTMLAGIVLDDLKNIANGLKHKLGDYFSCLPMLQWLVGVDFVEETSKSCAVLVAAFRWSRGMLRTGVWFLLLVALLGVLAEIVVPKDDDPDEPIIGTDEVLILPGDPPGCVSDRCCDGCGACVDDSSFPILREGQRFVFIYPYWKENDGDDGVNPSDRTKLWLDVIRHRASACATVDAPVELKVAGFASDQRVHMRDRKGSSNAWNCGLANARALAVYQYLKGSSARDVKVVQCPDETNDREDLGAEKRTGGLVNVEYRRWESHGDMLRKRKHWKIDSVRQTFLSRSVVIYVKRAGICVGES